MAMTFTQQDVVRIADILAEASRIEIMPRFKALTDGEVRHKSSIFDPVTEADEAAERFISAELGASFPGALIVGEEATSADPSLLDRLDDAPLAFVVDPIDGTRNFVAGLPLFGVMAAAVVRGEIVAGVIHDPVCQDTVQAVKGGGAWFCRDGRPARRLHVAPAAPLDRMEGIVGTHFLPEPMRTTVLNNLPRLGSATWLRCAAHEYRMAAAGYCHVLFFNRSGLVAASGGRRVQRAFRRQGLSAGAYRRWADLCAGSGELAGRAGWAAGGVVVSFPHPLR
jgi:fructose-1,6-bisphosphatase/inositol monophosphatase family enzyme